MSAQKKILTVLPPVKVEEKQEKCEAAEYFSPSILADCTEKKVEKDKNLVERLSEFSTIEVEGVKPNSMSYFLRTGFPTDDFLVEKIIPRQGLFLVYGDSDCGKSTLLKDLAMAIVNEAKWLYWQTYPKHKRVVYLSTEDCEGDIHRTVFRMKKEWEAMGYDMEHSNIDFLFGAENDWEQKIDKACAESPLDLIIIDTLGDIVKEDSNSESVIRKELEKLSTLCRKYNCACGYIHHTTKASEKIGGTPSKHFASGSGAITRKPRVCIQVARRDNANDIIGLVFTKGNTLGADLKKYIHAVAFNKEPYTFTQNEQEIEDVSLSFQTSQSHTISLADWSSWRVTSTGGQLGFEASNAKKKEEKEERIKTAKTLKAEGKTNSEIARIMGCSSESVRKYLNAQPLTQD